MRPAPGQIPTTMPSYDEAVRNIVYLMDMPRPRLMDYSISELVNLYGDGTPKWLVGSTVWLPAVFGEVDKNTDLDIVFQTKAALERFADGAFLSLNARISGAEGYIVTNNGNNGKRFYHPDGVHVMDLWHLEEDESIQEMLMTFPYNYQRCAYFMTWSGSSPAYLTRIVKERQRMQRQTLDRYGRAIPTGVNNVAVGYTATEPMFIGTVQVATPPVTTANTGLLDFVTTYGGGYGR